MITKPKYIFFDLWLNEMNKRYFAEHTGIIPKDKIDEFFACAKCHTVGCDCEIEQPTEE